MTYTETDNWFMGGKRHDDDEYNEDDAPMTKEEAKMYGYLAAVLAGLAVATLLYLWYFGYMEFDQTPEQQYPRYKGWNSNPTDPPSWVKVKAFGSFFSFLNPFKYIKTT